MEKIEAEYDDKNLQQLFVALEPRRRLQAMKGAFRREANNIRKTAIGNLRATGIKGGKDLERGIRAMVFKRNAGFRVTIGTKKANKAGKGERGFYTNRRGEKKPVLIWAEDGTKMRRTKGGRRLAHGTGSMVKYGFMVQTLNDVKNSVTTSLHNEIADNIVKTSKKYGCK